MLILKSNIVGPTLLLTKVAKMFKSIHTIIRTHTAIYNKDKHLILCYTYVKKMHGIVNNSCIQLNRL